MLVLSVCIIHTHRKEAFIFSKGISNTKDEHLLFIDNSFATVIDISSQKSSSVYDMVSALDSQHITQISAYILTHYHSGTQRGLERATSSIKINRVFLPIPKSTEEMKYALQSKELLENRGISYEFYNNNTNVDAAQISFRKRPYVSAANENNYILGVKFKQSNICYLSESVPLYPALPLSDKIHILILGLHDRRGEGKIKFTFPENIEQIIFAEERPRMSEEFYSALKDKVKAYAGKTVKIKIK